MNRSKKNNINKSYTVSDRVDSFDNDVSVEYGEVTIKRSGSNRRLRTRRIKLRYGVNKAIGSVNGGLDYIQHNKTAVFDFCQDDECYDFNI